MIQNDGIASEPTFRIIYGSHWRQSTVEGNGGFFQIRNKVFQINGPFVIGHSVVRNDDEIDAAENVFRYHPVHHSSKLSIHFQQFLSNL